MIGKLESIILNKRKILIYTPNSYNSINCNYPVLYCNDGDIMEKSINKIIEKVEKSNEENKTYECIIVMIYPMNRGEEYTPWKSKNPFDNSIFSGNGDKYLSFINNTVKSFIDNNYRTIRDKSYIMGYSLGGLISVYAMYKIFSFKKAACISSSLWYDGWLEFIKSNKIINKDSEIFLSLGKNECKTKNKIVSKVQENTYETYKSIKNQININGKVEIVLNEGGHFSNVEERYLSAIQWLNKKELK